MTDNKNILFISEIFKSIQGESSRAGLPCILVRLAGCNLNCSWCDTHYARNDDDGKAMTIGKVLDKVDELKCKRVEITGGEPMLQHATPRLLECLCEAGYETLLETNGSVNLADIDKRVRKIVDIKCPASGETANVCWENLDHLHKHDEVKFVIASWADYEFAREVVKKHNLTHHCSVIFSPVWGKITGAMLAEWILADGLDVRLGMQLHKIIWPDKDRGV